MKAVIALLAAGVCGWAGVQGRVVDARGGEPLARVRVQITGTTHETATDSDGRFAFPLERPGEYTLHVETVGYRLLTQRFVLAEGETQEFDIILTPDTFRRTDSVVVTAGPFDVPGVSAPAELNLTGGELKNLGTVLMDDPLRAVAALPGVASNNDFASQFTVLAAPFTRVGFYLDDVLMHAPYHAIATDETTGSLSMLNGEMVSDLALLAIAPPVRYSDRGAAAMDVRSRDGTRTKPSVRVAAGVASATALVEGPLAKARGSYLVSARKSYLQYLMSRATEDASILVAFQDLQGKLAYDVTRAWSVNLYLLTGTTGLDRSSARPRSGVNAIIDGENSSSVVRAGWRYAPSQSLVATGWGAWLRERFESVNRDSRPLRYGGYGEWTGGARVTWAWAEAQTTEAGWSARRLRADGNENLYFTNVATPRQIDSHRGTALRHNAYTEQSWSVRGGALRGSAGVRFDAHSWSPGLALSPVASLAWRPFATTEFQFGWGQYVQYPELALLASPFGGARLAPERSNHAVAAVEQRLGTYTRVRLQAWNRDDRDLIVRPFLDPRLIAGRVVVPNDLRLYNSVRGYSRGMQILLQTRSANRVTGWVGYTLGWARQRDRLEQQHFWAPEDQRHIANLYLSYRLRPSLNLSGRYSYASGEPIPTYVEQRDGAYFVAASRNQVRMQPYSRLDFRANKSFTYDRWKLTVYGELINVTNRRNVFLVSYDGANTRTGQAFLTFDRVFPIVPAGGITLEF